MKTVLLLGGHSAGQRVDVHGAMTSYRAAFGDTCIGFFEMYKLVPMCSHGEVHWFGVLDGADPLALLIAGYGVGPAPEVDWRHLLVRYMAKVIDAESVSFVDSCGGYEIVLSEAETATLLKIEAKAREVPADRP